MASRKILVTGASIAGPALAYWLGRSGNDVVVLERARAFRDGGQNIDIRGDARDVVERMGLLQAVRDQGTGETGMRFVDAHDRTRARFGAEGDGMTAELEILRGDLSRILVEASADRAGYRFGDAVERIDDDGDGVDVTFAGGGRERFDLVLAAEGVSSSTRTMLFGDGVQRKPYDLYMGYFTIPRGGGDVQDARWYSAPGGRSVLLRPDRAGTTRAVLVLRRKPCGYEALPPAEQKRVLIDHFAGAGWETARVLAGLREAGDFYFEMVSQVRLPAWSRGRVALVGDAAWSTGPISGMGTSLGLIGAYVLAGELATTADVAQAFAIYEKRLRLLVNAAQGIPKIAPVFLQPRSRVGVALQRVALGVAASSFVRRLSRGVSDKPNRTSDLPAYPALETVATGRTRSHRQAERATP